MELPYFHTNKVVIKYVLEINEQTLPFKIFDVIG